MHGKLVLHPQLYGPDIKGGIAHAKHTTIEGEIIHLAQKMVRDNQITADITIIPLTQTIMTSTQLWENIKSAQAIKLYNLCSILLEKQEISKITDSTILATMQKLEIQAAEDSSLNKIPKSPLQTILAALACTHAISQGSIGHSHAIDSKIGPDQPTQIAVIYCTISLIGSEKFAEFASKINFNDNVTKYTK